LEYNKNVQSLSNTLSDAIVLTQSKFEWMESVKFKIFNTISPNLGAIAVFGKKMSTPKRCFTIRCNQINCKSCSFVYTTSFFKLKNGIILPLLSDGNCNSSNCVYIIICSLCNKYYIGQTGQLIKERIKQRLRAIRLFKPYLNPTTEIGYHFNLRHHKTSEHFKFVIFKENVNEFNERLSIETDLIHLINSFNSPALNALIPSNCKIKKTCFS
jgi:hypothetical protein